MDQAERERAVGARSDLQPHVRLVGQPHAPRVDHQQLRAARLRRGDVGGHAQEVAGRARRPRGRCTGCARRRAWPARRAERVVRGAGVARPLAEVRGAADVRRAEVMDQPLEPPLGVGERGAADRPLVERHRLRPRGRADLEHPPRDQVERLVPAARLPARVGIGLRARAAQRDVDAVAWSWNSGAARPLAQMAPPNGCDRSGSTETTRWPSTVVTTGQCTAQNPQ